MSARTETLWYAGGLAFSCRGCGDCCRGPGGYVWVAEKEIPVLAEALGEDLETFFGKYLRKTWKGFALVDGPSGDCVLLDENGRCRAYAARPAQCRTYPWWPEILRSPRAWDKEKQFCPGVGNGPVHPATTIRKALEGGS